MSDKEHPGFTPTDEELDAVNSPDLDRAIDAAEDTADAAAQQPPKRKNNPTPDLSDEQYIEQLFLIAQALAVMPGQRDNMPNVTTPPPIRPRWAAFLLSLGLRIQPALASHRLVNNQGPAVGNWGPRERVEVSKARTSMKRADMMEVWEQVNPETFAAVKNGTMTKEDLLNQMPADMQQAVAALSRLRAQEAEQKAAAEAAAKAKGG